MSRPEPPTQEDSRAQAAPSRTWRKTARIGGGVILTLLGLLWALQGADVVQIRPIGCVAECEPIEGGSAGWFTVGVLTLLGGLRLLGARRRR